MQGVCGMESGREGARVKALQPPDPASPPLSLNKTCKQRETGPGTRRTRGGNDPDTPMCPFSF